MCTDQDVNYKNFLPNLQPFENNWLQKYVIAHEF